MAQTITDETAVVVPVFGKRCPPQLPETVELLIERTHAAIGESVSAIRTEVSAELRRCGAACVDDVRLLVTELTTNVVKHAKRSGTMTVRVSACQSLVLIEVFDHARRRKPRLRNPRDRDGRGRGLHIVVDFAKDCGYWRTKSGKEVWALLASSGSDL